ncbi:DUF2235 domain-containing protein [Rhizobium ruizarguesonis]
MAGKRIILLLDGTWNDQDVGPFDTNIVRLQSLIGRALTSAQTARPSETQNNGSEKLVRGYASDGRENIVYYERGVGTSAFDRIRGGAFGDGLAHKVRRAYKFLSYHFVPGDNIFIFGFSRGAYTARSLVGYLGAAGLLKREYCTETREPIAWNYYRTNPGDRLPGTWCDLAPFTHDRATFSVDCLGVFDTVGALGVPLDRFYLINRDRFSFHNVELSSITKVNLHAMAIDEHRKPFEATIWRKPKFKHFNTVTEQVWFPGAHADIGGGYIPEEQRLAEFPYALDDVPLDWMMRRVRHYFDSFPCELPEEPPGDKCYAAPHHEPRQKQYKLYPLALRSISNYRTDKLLRWQAEVSRDRHAAPIAEMVHVAAIRRLGQMVQTEGGERRYLPQNLLSVLPQIEATYRIPEGTSPPSHDVLLVARDGRPIDPSDPVERNVAAGILDDARRGLTESAS